jgi:hypothetical protein
MDRTYVIEVTVTVTDDKPDDADHEEDVVYAAYAKAKADLNDNAADWSAREVTD